MFIGSRVLKIEGDTAIVEGMGLTRAEARLQAEKKVKKIFGEYIETKEAEYTSKEIGDEYRSNTYIICTMYIKKK